MQCLAILPRPIKSLNFFHKKIENDRYTTKFIIYSHFKRSQTNLKNFLYFIELSNLSIRYIFITEQRYNKTGKRSIRQALSARFTFIYDDNPEVVFQF